MLEIQVPSPADELVKQCLAEKKLFHWNVLPDNFLNMFDLNAARFSSNSVAEQLQEVHRQVEIKSNID